MANNINAQQNQSIKNSSQYVTHQSEIFQIKQYTFVADNYNFIYPSTNQNHLEDMLFGMSMTGRYS